MTNVNPDTGIRYGVIALNNLDGDTAQWLFYEGENLSEQEYSDEARQGFERDWDDAMEEAAIAASEVDPNMSDAEREAFIETRLEATEFGSNRDNYVERQMDHIWDHCEIEEPFIHGECEGVKYQITWLGGAPLLWVLEGPVGFANELCSPCVPNAANLDGGFEPTTIPIDQIHRDHDGYLCYVVPQDWLAKEVA